MNANTLESISYITSVAVSELPILTWVSMLSYIYPDGIPEDAQFGTVINYFVEQFPDFEQRSQDISQNGLDTLYDDFIKFIENMIKK